MRLQTNITVSNPSRFGLRVAKFFQVVFLGRPTNTGARQVDVFTAIIASSTGYESNYPSITISSQIGNSPQVLADIGSEFYQRIDILRQFWGEGSDRLDRVEDVRKFALLDEDSLRLIAKVWPAGEAASPFMIHEPVKSQTPVLVFPSKSIISDSSSSRLVFPWLGSGVWGLNEIRMAAGIWQHASFVVRDPGPDEVLHVEHLISVSGALQFDEIRIYYALPGRSDLQHQSGVLNYRRSAALTSSDGQLEVEVHELFSQPHTEYFPSWNRLGIKNSTLLRLNPSAEFETRCREQFAKEINLQMRVVDAALLRRRDRKALIASIVLATATAVGVDETRISGVERLLPWLTYMTGTFWWVAMCLSLLPILLPPPKPLHPRAALFLSRIAISLFVAWAVVAFFLSEAVKEWMRAHLWALYVPPVLCAISMAILTTQRLQFSIVSWWTRVSAERRNRRVR